MTQPLPSLNPETWLEDHGDYLFRYALLRVSRRGIAEDLVQETFLTAWRARNAFAGRSSEKTWLTGILRHKILDHLRKFKHDHQPADSDCDLENCFDEWEHWSAKSPLRPELWSQDPSILMENREFEEALEDCLSVLAPRAAESFLLHEVEEMKPKEIARILQVSTTNVYTLLHRARFQLRACLQKSWPSQKKFSTPP